MARSSWRQKDPGGMDIRLCTQHMAELNDIRPQFTSEWEPDDSGDRCWACLYFNTLADQRQNYENPYLALCRYQWQDAHRTNYPRHQHQCEAMCHVNDVPQHHICHCGATTVVVPTEDSQRWGE